MGLRIGIISAALCLPLFMTSSAEAITPAAPLEVDWVEVETAILEFDYFWLEKSPRVEFLQYILRIEIDGVYGPQTHAGHFRKGLLLGVAINAPEPSSRTFPENVERWRSDVVAAIARYGGPASDIDRFLAVMRCESQGLPDATNPSSGAAGLMQQLPQFWDWRARMAGYEEGASPYDPIVNINVSAWLLYEHVAGGWSHWNFGCLG